MGDHIATTASFTVAWENARLARATALQPPPVAPAEPRPAPAAAEWRRLVDGYNNKYVANICCFPERMLLGAGSVLARMLHEYNISHNFTPVKLGEITQELSAQWAA
eukprot:6826681-Heterocapsa_arctica.AAC.1